MNVQHCSFSSPQANGKTIIKVKSFSGKELSLIRGAIYRRIIFEIKPRLTSVSNATGQIKSYSHFLTYKRYYQGVESTRMYEPHLVLLTLHSDSSYDQMLASQFIDIIHIPPKELTK